MDFQTADLCDAHDDRVQVVAPLFRSYGGRRIFSGPIATLKLFEDNGLVRQALEQPGNGRVLVIDGGGSLRCALIGDQLAALAVTNNWSGFLVWGCIRDSRAIGEMGIGALALATHPRKTVKRNQGDTDIPVTFAGASFRPGEWLYADEDGIIIAPNQLL